MRRRVSRAIKKAGAKAKAGIRRASTSRRGKMLAKAVKAKGRGAVRKAQIKAMAALAK